MKLNYVLSLIMLLAIHVQMAAIDVTFVLDMNGVAVDYTTPEVNGQFNNWCGACAPMSDEDGDGIWELVIDLEPGTYEYKFSADNWNEQETLVSGMECTITTGAFVNRILTVEAAPIVLPTVCWGLCVPCGEGPTVTNVTFKVDMSQVTETFTTPEINGTFNDWCGGCALMTDEDGDNVWEITISIVGDSAEYKYAADVWNIQEELTEGAFCTITTDGFTNRYLELTGGELELEIVCWGSCQGCIVNVEESDLLGKAKIYPNPTQDAFRIDGIEKAVDLEVYGLDGRMLLNLNQVRNGQLVSVSALPAGCYIVRILTQHSQSSRILRVD